MFAIFDGAIFEGAAGESEFGCAQPKGRTKLLCSEAMLP